jgi:hypothetical protein
MIASKPIRLGKKPKKKGKAKAARPPRQIATIEKPLYIRVKSDPDAVVVVQLQFGYGGLWSAGWLLSTRDLRSEVGADKLDGYTTRELAIVSAVTKMLAAILKQVQSYDEPNPQAEARLRKLGKDLRDYRARLDRAMKPAATPARLVGEQSGALSNLRVGPYIGGDPAAFARAALGKKKKPAAANGKTTTHGTKPNKHGAYVPGVKTVHIPIHKTLGVKAIIRLACDDGQWRAGHDLSGPDFASYGGPHANDTPFSNRAEAVAHAAAAILDRLIEATRHACSDAKRRKLEKAQDDVRTFCDRHAVAENGKPKTGHSPLATRHSSPSTALVPVAPRSPKAGPLSSAERRELDKLEAVVAEAQLGFVASAHALKQIEDSELWRGEFPSFPLYLRDRWGYSYSYVCKLIKAATVAKKAAPIAEKLGVVLRTESQFRELRDIEPDDVPEVLRLVAKRVEKDAQGNRRPTAAELKAAVREYTTPEDDAHQEAAAVERRFGEDPSEVRGMFTRGPQSIAAGTIDQAVNDVIDVTPRPGIAEFEDPFLEEVSTAKLMVTSLWNGQQLPYGAALQDLRDRIRRLAELAGSGYPQLTTDLASLLRSIANEIEPAALRRKAK